MHDKGYGQLSRAINQVDEFYDPLGYYLELAATLK